MTRFSRSTHPARGSSSSSSRRWVQHLCTSLGSSSSSSGRRRVQGTYCCSIPNRQVNNPAPARDVIAVVEEEASEAAAAAAAAAARPAAPGPPASSSSSSSSSSQEPKYKALLAIILKLIEQEQQQQQQQQGQQQQEQQGQQQPARWQRLEAFLRAQSTATSIPFICWLADLEAGASGAYKAQLAQLCEVLVVLREQQDREGQEALYADTLALLSGGDEQALSLMADDPRQYALALAEGMTGQPLQLQGYGPAYDALLQVAPAAALMPEAIAAGHQLAEELAADLSSRRKSTVAAMLGRVQLDSLSQKQQAALLGPSPAARILDLLLSLPSSGDRLALLPDCFTPPLPFEPEAAAAAAAAAAGGVKDDGETDELWCTPMQLLNEIDRRLNAAAGGAAVDQPAGSSAVQALPPGNSSSSSSSSSSSGDAQAAALPAPGDAASEGGGLFGAELLAALQELREHIQQQWLESLPTPS